MKPPSNNGRGGTSQSGRVYPTSQTGPFWYGAVPTVQTNNPTLGTPAFYGPHVDPTRIAAWGLRPDETPGAVAPGRAHRPRDPPRRV